MRINMKSTPLIIGLCATTILAACGGNDKPGAVGATASAADYPKKPITMMVGSAAGSGVDVMARQAAAALKSRLGTPIVVRNLTGGDGASLMNFIKAQPADGYTIGVNARGQLISLNTSLRSQFKLDDWTFLAEMETDPYVLVVRSQSPSKTFQEFIDNAKNSGSVSIAGFGANSAQHLVELKVAQLAKMNAKYVPFDGGSEVVTTLLGGHVDAGVTNVGQVAELVKAGKVRVLAVAAKDKIAALPDTPTFADVGLPSVTVPHWRGFYVKAGTPQPIVDVLINSLTALSADPAWKAGVEKSGQIAEFTSGEDWSKQIHADFIDMQPLLKQAGLMN